MDAKKRRHVTVLLSRSKSEKLCKVTSIKMPWSIVEAVKLVASNGGISSFIRQAVQKQLEELTADG